MSHDICTHRIKCHEVFEAMHHNIEHNFRKKKLKLVLKFFELKQISMNFLKPDFRIFNYILSCKNMFVYFFEFL